MKLQDIYKYPADKDGWRTLPDGRKWRVGEGCFSGDGFTAGDWFKAGDRFKAGDWFTAGDHFTAGDGFTAGDRFKAGDWFKAGDHFTAGDRFKAGYSFTAGDGWDSLQAQRDAITMWPDATILIKWVTQDRKSPNWDGGTVIDYPVGARIECPEAEISDKQCAPGLHCFVPGYRPEWSGYLQAGHDLQAIHVEVRREDLCFVGYPGDMSKVRVRALTVLD